jgi:cytochrome c553
MTAKAMMKKSVLGLFVIAAFVVATAAPAADLKAGEAKVKAVCQACHGADGNTSNADYPKLGGQYPDYLAKALRDYKSGARKNAIMGAFAGTLSPADIENVSAYYAAQPAVLVTRH